MSGWVFRLLFPGRTVVRILFGLEGLRQLKHGYDSNEYFVASVGRRSSVLKMKPTPPVPETVSTKRPRSAPRSSVLKRKVLMDDTMVLHGEYVLFPIPLWFHS